MNIARMTTATTTTDAALQTGVARARLATIDWLDSMRIPDAPAGVMRISAAHDPATWPDILLPGTYNGILCLDLIDGLSGLEDADRAGLVDWIEGFRLEDGRFRMPAMRDGEVFKKPDPEETWRYIDFHVTNYALAAIAALAPDRPPVLAFARPFLDPVTLKAWLAERDLRDPWQEGNNIVNLASFLQAIADHGSERDRTEVDRAFAILFDWHNRLQEPDTGFWGVGQTDPARRREAMAGAVHNFHLWYRRGRPIPYQDRAIDYALSCPPAVHSACIDVDLVDLLVHGARRTDHRGTEITEWLTTLLAGLLAAQNPDGGFCDERNGVRRQDGWVGGYTEPQGISNTFATWFRWIAIAMIADHLWPGWQPWRFRPSMGIGYRAGSET